METDNKLYLLYYLGALSLIAPLLQHCDGIRDNTFQKVCDGSSNKLSFTRSKNSTQPSRYQRYVQQYANCTVILTNLEIIFLNFDDLETNETYDMSFLESIEEIHGYVLIAYNHIDSIPLTNLRVIHGRYLYTAGQSEYSLFISHNVKLNSTEVGLRELRLNSLHEIVNGNVSLMGNNLLCHVDTIEWKDILTNPKSTVEPQLHVGKEYQRRECEIPCHESCHQNFTGSSHCWAPGSDNCQQFHRLVCSDTCDGNCYGPDPRQCCNPQCVGGCLGAKSECWACRNFIDGDDCVGHCPPAQIYKNDKFVWEPNPNVKYAYKHMCVDKCAGNMYVRNGACVTSCGEGHAPSGADSNECVPCGETCPKNCTGGEVTSETIHKFINCTIIQGSLKFLSHSFKGYRNLYQETVAPLNLSNLTVFETVEEITDCLQVERSPEELQSLGFLKNLRKILGHQPCFSSKPYTVQFVQTRLKSIGLTSLEYVANGTVLIFFNNDLEELDLVSLKSVSQAVVIQQNPSLCYFESLNWTRFTRYTQRKFNRNQSLCEQENKTCSDLCSGGCWGSGDDKCVDCVTYRFEKQCIPDCYSIPGQLMFVEENETRVCKKCHSECSEGCNGEKEDNCAICRNVKDGKYCRTECPVGKYPDSQKKCQVCSGTCTDQGCSGPGSYLGPGGCNACQKYKKLEGTDKYQCLFVNNTCEDEYYERNIPVPKVAETYEKTKSALACAKCHKECKSCRSYGPDCPVCKNWREENQCVSGCSLDHFPDEASRQCRECDDSCIRCHGPTNQDCSTCRYLKVYSSDIPKDKSLAGRAGNSTYKSEDNGGNATSAFRNETLKDQFYCVEECPDWAPVKYNELKNNHTEAICITKIRAAAFNGLLRGPESNIYIPIAAVLGVLALLVGAGCFVNRVRVRRKEEEERKTAEILGMETLAASSPSDYKPDLSNLRVINEAELTRGKTIGSGAFGTVYQGIWAPPGERIKIPVAIKVLQKGASSAEMNTELLEEARIMATVRHEHCIRILAVSLTAELMLITQLMPNGSLLDYVRKYRDRIGSNALLTWSKQIAQGMQYLEELGIVHRDLAARNVLVEGPQTVKITDFGLAKLVYNKEYLAEGGKLPIKWLALESIQHRVFTHKSDVWSYGVTLWEVFSYGQRPYDTVSARDLCDLLEMGERLPQPQICTIDVYMILIKCWMVDAQSRPTFGELVDTFTCFANDPGRYLVTQEEDSMQFPSEELNFREMLRGLSILEGDKVQVISAEDYLRPHDLVLDHLAMGNTGVNYTNFGADALSPLVSPVNCKTFDDQDSRSDSQPRRPGEIDRQPSERYCPNPSRDQKLTKVNSYTSSGEIEGLRRPQQVKPIEQTVGKVTDDDDYLRPLSVANKRPTYIEVLRQSTPDLEDDYIEGKTDYVNSQVNDASKENPEYFQSARMFQPTA